MRYDSEKTYEIGYYDPKLDDYIQIHTDSLATAVRALIVRARRYPNRRIDLSKMARSRLGHDDLLGWHEQGQYSWQGILRNQDWQEYISSIITKK